MTLADAGPNLNSVWIALIQMLGTGFAVYLAYRQTRKGQDPKLDKIAEVAAKTETLVNGDRAAKEERIRWLESKLRDAGLDIE